MRLHAGYRLDCLLRQPRNPTNPGYTLDTILPRLSCFDLDSDLKAPEPQADPILAVATNLISRGTPTKPSILIERSFADALDITEEKVSATGSIEYRMRADKVSSDLYAAVERACYAIDPRLTADIIKRECVSYYRCSLSKAESKFLFELVPERLHQCFVQLLQPQIELEAIIGAGEFTDQRVDFALWNPLGLELAGVVIEIDDPQHQTNASQRLLDQRRNTALRETNWEILRFKTAELFRPSDDEADRHWSRLVELLRSSYFLRVVENYDYPLIEQHEGRLALQLVLSPLAIARIQKTILQYALSGQLPLSAPSWKIAVIERDVPAAHLAVTDLKDWVSQLFRLEGRVYDDNYSGRLTTTTLAGCH